MATVTWDSGVTSKGQADGVSYTYTNDNFINQLNAIPPYSTINSVKITAKFQVNLYTNNGGLTVGSKTWTVGNTDNHDWITIVNNEDITPYLTGGSGAENAGALPNITVYANKRMGFVRTFKTQVTITWDYTEPHSHSYTTEISRTPSTCCTKGSVTKKCSCGGTQTTELALDPNNHSGGTEIRNAKAATCSATGYTGDTYCKGCGAKLSSGSTIAKKAHTEVTIPAVPATCESTGLTAGKKCSVCGTIITAQQTVAALGHSWNAPTYTWSADGKSCTAQRVCKTDSNHKETATATITSAVKTAATCIAKGTTTYTAKFSVSWASTQTKDVQDIPAKGHTWVDATCTKPKTCSVCGATEGSALGHNYVGVVTKQPTCTEKGVKTYTCQNDSSHKYTEEIPAKGHTEVIDKAVEPTCTTTGKTEGKHCSVCGAVLVAQQTIPALGHSFTNYKSDNNATCTEDGTKTAKCDRCDATDTVVDVGSAKGHDFSTEIARTPATCVKTGSVTMQCSCGETQVIELPIDPDNHRFTLISMDRVADCEIDGYTGDKYCVECGALVSKGTVIPATGHNYTSVTYPPTEDSSGYTEYTCDNPNCPRPTYIGNRIYPVKVILLNSETVYFAGQGETITIEAPAVEGYKFVKWVIGSNESEESTMNPFSWRVFFTITIRAVYEKTLVPIKVNEEQVTGVYIVPSTNTIVYVINGEVPVVETKTDTVDEWHFLVSNTIPENGYPLKKLLKTDENGVTTQIY